MSTGSEDGQGLPALVYYHGGGWVIGNLDSVDRTCRALANASGCVLISVDYRLAPEDKFPAAVEDADAALRYVAHRAAELGIDPNRIAVGGDSAGGNLAAVVAQISRDRGSPRLAFQLLIYPVVDRDDNRLSLQEFAQGYLLTRPGMDYFWAHYLPKPEDGRHPHASPIQAESLAGLPPALVITAECDPIRDQGEAYAKRLQESERSGGYQTLRRRDPLLFQPEWRNRYRAPGHRGCGRCVENGFSSEHRSCCVSLDVVIQARCRNTARTRRDGAATEWHPPHSCVCIR